MQANWLRNRLTKAKQQAPMWAELADAVQEVFEQHIEPLVERLRGMGGAFTMAEEDLDARINELGPFFFLSERVEPEDWPLALIQRQDEIHYKNTEWPMLSTIGREFTGMSVTWSPQWAPKDINTYPYGTRFTTKEAMPFEDIPESGWFMTSRGVIRVSLPELARSFPGGETQNEQTAEFEAILARFIAPLIPLRIVFDGAQYYIGYTLKEADEWIELLATDIHSSWAPAEEGGEGVNLQSAEIGTSFPPLNNDSDSPVGQLFLDVESMDAWTLDKPIT